jgi:hypothetical protein
VGVGGCGVGTVIVGVGTAMVGATIVAAASAVVVGVGCCSPFEQAVSMTANRTIGTKILFKFFSLLSINLNQFLMYESLLERVLSFVSYKQSL